MKTEDDIVFELNWRFARGMIIIITIIGFLIFLQIEFELIKFEPKKLCDYSDECETFPLEDNYPCCSSVGLERPGDNDWQNGLRFFYKEIENQTQCYDPNDCIHKPDLVGCEKLACNWCCFNVCNLLYCYTEWNGSERWTK